MKNNENGFGAVVLIIIVLLIGVMALTGWYVYDKNSDKETENNKSSQTAAEVKQTDGFDVSDTETAPYLDGDYYVVPSWGVKIGTGDNGEKVSVSSPDKSEPQSIVISVKPAYDFYKDCTSSIMITKYEKDSDDVPAGSFGFQINGYSYLNSGISECGGATESGVANGLTHMDLLDAYDAYGAEAL